MTSETLALGACLPGSKPGKLGAREEIYCDCVCLRGKQILDLLRCGEDCSAS
jgi:hypothetical protein